MMWKRARTGCAEILTCLVGHYHRDSPKIKPAVTEKPDIRRKPKQKQVLVILERRERLALWGSSVVLCLRIPQFRVAVRASWAKPL